MFSIRKKSESFEYFEKSLSYAEVHLGQKLNKIKIHSYSSISSIPNSFSDVIQLKALISDSGSESVLRAFASYLSKRDILHRLTFTY